MVGFGGFKLMEINSNGCFPGTPTEKRMALEPESKAFFCHVFFYQSQFQLQISQEKNLPIFPGFFQPKAVRMMVGGGVIPTSWQSLVFGFSTSLKLTFIP